MKNYNSLLLLIVIVFLFSCEKKIELNTGEERINTSSIFEGEGTYIVVLKPDYKVLNNFSSLSISNKKIQAIVYFDGLFNNIGVTSQDISKTYTSLFLGFATHLTKQQYQSLIANDLVDVIEKDFKIQLDFKKSNKISRNQIEETIIPWGVEAVGGPEDGTGKTVWVIDSGVDHENQNLLTDVDRSVNYSSSGKPNGQDDSGHGTHVAGTIVAKGPDIFGVASGATIISVKVLDSVGSGNLSQIIEGMDYVSANAEVGDVVNMSFGGDASFIEDFVVLNMADKGLYLAIAAGNNANNVIHYSPARTSGEGDGNEPNIYTITAFDEKEEFATFSNYGNIVDYSAPGVDIESTKLGGGTIYYSGTSMAAPHVSGILLVNNGIVMDKGYEPSNVTNGEKSGNIVSISEPCDREYYVFSSQKDVDNFLISNPRCTKIKGSVTIVGTNVVNDIHDLSALKNIKKIDGNLSISNNNDLETLLGFDSLEIVKGNITVRENKILRSFEGLEKLLSVADITIDANANLSNLIGLNGLEKITSSLKIYDNENLRKLKGLDSLEEIKNDVLIKNNQSLYSIDYLKALIKIGGNIEVTYNLELIQCKSFCFLLDKIPDENIIWHSNGDGCEDSDVVLDLCDNKKVLLR